MFDIIHPMAATSRLPSADGAACPSAIDWPSTTRKDVG